MILRCTAAPDDDYSPLSGFQDAALSHLLSVQYLSQKLGLARHILAVTTQYIDSIYDYNYFNLDLTHTDNTSINTTLRMNALSHCPTQTSERQLTDGRIANNLSGSPVVLVPVPPVLFSVSDQQIIPAWLHRRVAHTLGATTLWHRPHPWLTGQHHCLSRPKLSCPGASRHGIGNWFDIRSVMGSNVQIPPSIHYLWQWAPASEIPAVRSAFPPPAINRLV